MLYLLATLAAAAAMADSFLSRPAFTLALLLSTPVSAFVIMAARAPRLLAASSGFLQAVSRSPGKSSGASNETGFFSCKSPVMYGNFGKRLLTAT
jgi:hypothetical protein